MLNTQQYFLSTQQRFGSGSGHTVPFSKSDSSYALPALLRSQPK